MNIKPTDFVLEIGSGNNPNARADILCDRYIENNGERAGEFRAVIDRPMIIADGYTLPFADDTFDYVICSHILEHMDNPQAFIKEVMRVGKRGYIEVPSAMSERIFGWDFHHWYCSLESGVLRLRKKTTGVQVGGFFHRLIVQAVWFRRFFEKHEKLMYIKYEWTRKVNLKIETSEPQTTWVRSLDNAAWKLLEDARPDVFEDMFFYMSWMLRRAKKKGTKILRLIRWNVQNTLMPQVILNRIVPLICCPQCKKTNFSIQSKTVKCVSCQAGYPIVRKTIPLMLTKAQIAQGY